MSTKRVSFPASALSLAAIVSLLAACAPAQRISWTESGAVATGPTLTIKKDIDMIRIEGVLNTPQEAERVVLQTSTMFDASIVIDDIVIDNSVADAGWLDSVLATVEGMAHISDFSVIAANGQMLVGGSVESPSSAASIETMASDMAGLDLAVTSNLVVPDSADDYVDIDLLAALDGEIVDPGEPVLLVEQPAVAAAQPVVGDVMSAVRVMPKEVVATQPAAPAAIVTRAANDPDPMLDTDADGVPDINDQCTSRAGYPVDNKGCQLLDGFLHDVRFTEQPAALIEGTEPELDQIAGLMQDYPDTRIAVISYARGESDIQRAMARKRAFLVTSYLEGQGVGRDRVQTFALSHQPGVGEKIMIKEID
ncbi:MAG: hypothetical protein AAF404_00665 [Pseudomonadota bacterium]